MLNHNVLVTFVTQNYLVEQEYQDLEERIK
jgi:hypothetical protein